MPRRTFFGTYLYERWKHRSSATEIAAEFYRTEAGNEPVREWLKQLSKRDRQRIGIDIRKTEYGWPVGMPTCDSLGDGLWEVRTNLDDRIARVFFCMISAKMILLHGIIKKSRIASKVDLDAARDRKRNLEERLRKLTKEKNR